MDKFSKIKRKSHTTTKRKKTAAPKNELKIQLPEKMDNKETPPPAINIVDKKPKKQERKQKKNVPTHNKESKKKVPLNPFQTKHNIEKKSTSIPTESTNIIPHTISTRTVPTNPIKDKQKDRPFKVIAGAFLMKENAQKAISSLKQKGIKAIIWSDPNGDYHFIEASAHADYTSAKEAVKQLKEKGIDCYVKKRTSL